MKVNKYLAAKLLVALVLFVGMCGCTCDYEGPGKTVVDYYKCCDAGKYDEAYNIIICLTQTFKPAHPSGWAQFNVLESRESFISWMSTKWGPYGDRATLDSVEVLEVILWDKPSEGAASWATFIGGTATEQAEVTVELEGYYLEGGEWKILRAAQTHNLIKVDSQWYILTWAENIKYPR